MVLLHQWLRIKQLRSISILILLPIQPPQQFLDELNQSSPRIKIPTWFIPKITPSLLQITPQLPLFLVFIADHSSPFFLSTGDHPGIGVYRPRWNKLSMLETRHAKNKIAFINGSLPRPETGNLYLNSWLRCNNKVMSWLVNSVSHEIAQSIMYFDLATDMWNDLVKRFNEGNDPRIFQLQTQLTRLQ
uniref:Retrotransposon Copia-like N-terminal domain-containing protein n=1 Tax=Cannabis sativa TaxID=3483 RepID=A0A803Q9L9_CANSA